MKEAFLKLHVAVLLAGGTGIFGKLIPMNEFILVWYRLMFSFVIFYILLRVLNKLRKITWAEKGKIGLVGLLLAGYWLFFYASIKASNVSIGAVCVSLMSIFTAIFEPIINRHMVSVREILFSMLSVFGILMIFQLDTRYRLGICLGIISSAFAALYSIVNKKVQGNYTSSTMLLYEMGGGFVGMTLLLPFVFFFTPEASIIPTPMEFTYLFLLAAFCTVVLYFFQIQVLKKISAFTVNLSFNLEPIYSIIFAMILFNEAKELNYSFYMGLGMIAMSVVLQTLNVYLSQRNLNARAMA